MRQLIEQLYHCQVLQWDEIEETAFAALQHGRLICADTLELLILALGENHRMDIAA